MKKIILIFISFFSISLLFAQKTYKWPYLGENVPRYIGIAAGYEGVKTDNILVGIVVNVNNLLVTPPVGGMVGGGLFRKQNMANSKVYSYEAEIGMYGGVILGLNYSYNITTSNQLSGFKPFIGVAAYNLQCFYGYCFYKSADDLNAELRHNRITFRYIIPVIRLKMKSDKS